MHAVFCRCHPIACLARFRAREPRNSALNNEQIAHEAIIAGFTALSRLRRRGASSAPQCRAGNDLDLPAHAVAAGRVQLPPSADLLGLWRRGDRTVRVVGRRLDDPRAAIALPTLGHVRNRQRAANATARGAMVSAMAVRALARCQRTIKPAAFCCAASKRFRIAGTPGTKAGKPHWFDASVGRADQCVGESTTTVTITMDTIPARSIW
jgi:hypothetical protein